MRIVGRSLVAVATLSRGLVVGVDAFVAPPSRSSASSIAASSETSSSYLDSLSPETVVVNGDVAAVDGDAVSPPPKVNDYDDRDERIAAYGVKNALLRVAAASDRGQAASARQREDASSLVEELASRQRSSAETTTTTTTSAAAEGTWELAYSSTQLFRSSPFFMAGRAVCETKEQAEQYDWFCDMHRAALAISNVGKVRQIIDADTLTSEFEVKVGAVPFLSDLTPFRYSGGWPVTIEGAIVSTASIDSRTSTEYSLFMDTVEIKGSNIPFLASVLPDLKLRSRDLGRFLEDNVDAYTNPKPVFRTVYLDDDTRISKDQDDNVFVYVRASDEADVTDYSDVTADLGLSKLLEGFNDAVTRIYL